VNHLDIALLPDLLEESRRERERQRERDREIREALVAQRAEQPSRFATLTTRLRHALQRDPRRPIVEGC
jgi:hypothetical protein